MEAKTTMYVVLTLSILTLVSIGLFILHFDSTLERFSKYCWNITETSAPANPNPNLPKGDTGKITFPD